MIGWGQLRTKRYGLQGLLVLATVLLMAFLAAPQAWVDESTLTDHWDVDANLSLDGVAHVNAEFEMDFFRTFRCGLASVLPTRRPGGGDGQFYYYEISGIHVSPPTASDRIHTTTDKGGNIQVRIGDASRYLREKHIYQISCIVTGLIAPNHPKSHLNEFNWNVISN